MCSSILCQLVRSKFFVLDLAGTDLVFFLPACMVLCFAFVTKTILVTHQCFICCWTVLAQHQVFLLFPLCPLSEWTGDRQKAGRRHSWGSWPKQTKAIFHASCPGCLSKVAVAWGLTGHLFAWEGGEWLLLYHCYFLLLLFFSSVIKLSCSWPMSFFLVFALPSLSPSC